MKFHRACAIIDSMKTIATIKKVEDQLIIELRDEAGTLIDMFPVDEIKEEG
jgi:hypothetical protein